MKNIKFNKQLLNTLLSYFLRGALLIMPFALTGYIISTAVKWMDSMINIKIPGLGMAITLVSITLFGYFGTTLMVRSSLDFIENFLIKVPLISSIYTSFKELIDAFVGNKKKFDKPVLARIDKDDDISRIGFITQESVEILGLSDRVAVYIPNSYSFSGDLYIIPRASVRLLEHVSSADVMKFILSGGVTALQRIEEELSTDQEETVSITSIDQS